MSDKNTDLTDSLDRCERELDRISALLWPKDKVRPKTPGVYALMSAAYRMRDIARLALEEREP